MSYFEEIRELTKNVPASLVDFAELRVRTNPPTQASSNFITNKEQGDWAENLIFRAINKSIQGYVAVKYGKSDDLIAGEDGFDDFYNNFQDELDSIGKRPDLLVFKQEDFKPELSHDISRLGHSDIEDYVKLAVAGLEVRSSSFLIDKYDSEIQKRTIEHSGNIMRVKDEILENYSDLLTAQSGRSAYRQILENITNENMQAISFRRPNWRSSDRLSKLTCLFKELKDSLTVVQKRDYLSITPKVEDLKVVYKWVEKFNVPHFYFQVFFDKSYGISFKDILLLLTEPDKEGEFYEISSDVKNQNKTTIKINTRKTEEIAYKISEPQHQSVRREMGRGRLLFYVTFRGGVAYLDVDRLKKLLGLK